MATVKHERGKVPRGKTDWAALDKLSDEEIERRALADPDGQPLTEEDMARMRRTPQVNIIRTALRVTQEVFAETYGLSLATVRDWEQGRTEPDQASKTLLKLIALMPHRVAVALSEEPRSGTDG